VSHASETKKISHLANKGKPHVKGGVKPSESTNNQTNTSNTSNQTNSTSNDASTQTDSTSSSTQQNFTAACNNSQSILNRQLNAYVVVENITTNISRVYYFPIFKKFLFHINFRFSVVSNWQANGAS